MDMGWRESRKAGGARPRLGQWMIAPSCAGSLGAGVRLSPLPEDWADSGSTLSRPPDFFFLCLLGISSSIDLVLGWMDGNAYLRIIGTCRSLLYRDGLLAPRRQLQLPIQLVTGLAGPSPSWAVPTIRVWEECTYLAWKYAAI